MISNILDLYKKIFNPLGIQFFYLHPPYSQIRDTDYGFREQIFENYDPSNFHTALEITTTEFPILIYKDEFKAEYCFLLLPEAWQQKYDATHLLIGPVVFEHFTSEEISSTLQENHLPISLYNDLVEFYNRIPVFPSRDLWVSLMEPLFDEIYEGTARREYYESHFHLSDTYETKDNSFSVDSIEARYEAEHKLLTAVQKGDFAESIRCLQQFQKFKINTRTTDSLRNRKNLTIALNTLLRKTIEESHIHPYYIDRTSSEFSAKIENCINESRLEAIALQMIRKYCSLARNYSTQHLSALVEKCVHQIHFHYSEPLSLELLAEANAVSTNYLSTLFHTETGKTITSYINETRINHSIFLLNTTKLSIGEISYQCGFSNANYFSRTFKKIKGITPMEYRKSVKSD